MPANNGDAAQTDAARNVYENCNTLGMDPILDDTERRVGHSTLYRPLAG